MAELTLDLFAPLVGEPFTIRAADGQIEAVLVSAEDAGPGPEGFRAPFALLWRGPLDAQLQQGLHLVEHPAIEPAEIFLVPVGQGADGVEYEAVFN